MSSNLAATTTVFHYKYFIPLCCFKLTNVNMRGYSKDDIVFSFRILLFRPKSVQIEQVQLFYCTWTHNWLHGYFNLRGWCCRAWPRFMFMFQRLMLQSMAKVYVTRRETFSSAHRLHSKALSDEENKKVRPTWNPTESSSNNKTCWQLYNPLDASL